MPCLNCGEEDVNTFKFHKKYCSRCYGSKRKYGEWPLKRTYKRKRSGECSLIWLKENRMRQEGKCWIYTGARVRGGYGTVFIHGHQMRVHRRVKELELGRKLRPDEVVGHECGHKACFNPAHLTITTSHGNSAESLRNQELLKQNVNLRLTIRRLLEVRCKKLRSAPSVNRPITKITGEQLTLRAVV